MSKLKIQWLVLACVLAIPSAWAIGPGNRPMEEDKGTIGIVCTDSDGHTFSPLSFATPEPIREVAHEQFTACLSRVIKQWEQSAAAIPSLGEREHALTRNVTTYVDGWPQYMTEFMSMRGRAIMRLREDGRR
jgi:hypothetical protein